MAATVDDNSESERSQARIVSAARLQEIVEEIGDNLRPWTRSESEVRSGVENDINVLKEQVRLEKSFFDQSAIKKSAQELRGAIAEIEKLLPHMPGRVAWRLFGDPPPELQYDEIEETYFIHIDKRSSDEIKQAFVGRFLHFQEELKRLRVECERLVIKSGGSHPNFNRSKNTCAWFAYGFIRELSERSATGTVDSVFRTISSLLYEVVSGEPNVDLKRACDDVLKDMRPPRLG